MAAPQRPVAADVGTDPILTVVLLLQLLRRADIEVCFCLARELARWDRATRTLHVNRTATPDQKQAVVTDLWTRLTSSSTRHLHSVGG